MKSQQQIKGKQLFDRQSDQTEFNGPTIICDGIQTPENFGSVLRIADAAGCRNIILLNSTLDLKHKKLGKLARSCDRHLNITSMELETFLQSMKFHSLIALEITSDSSNIFETDIKDCDGIIIGHETEGISDRLLSVCRAVHIPMYGINGSMNLSHALAISLYEWRRQQP